MTIREKLALMEEIKRENDERWNDFAKDQKRQATA